MQIKEIERINDLARYELKRVNETLDVLGTIHSGIGDYFAVVAVVPNVYHEALINLGWETYKPRGIFDSEGSMHMMKRSERFEGDGSEV